RGREPGAGSRVTVRRNGYASAPARTAGPDLLKQAVLMTRGAGFDDVEVVRLVPVGPPDVQDLATYTYARGMDLTGMMLPAAAWPQSHPRVVTIGDELARRRVRTRGLGWAGACCCLVVVLIIVLIVVLVSRRRRKPPPPPPQ